MIRVLRAYIVPVLDSVHGCLGPHDEEHWRLARQGAPSLHTLWIGGLACTSHGSVPSACKRLAIMLLSLVQFTVQYCIAVSTRVGGYSPRCPPCMHGIRLFTVAPAVPPALVVARTDSASGSVALAYLLRTGVWGTRTS